MTEVFHIIERPMYRVIIAVSGDGLDVDFEIQLTAKGKQYARTRARGFHRRIESDEDAIAEILNARDNWQAVRPDKGFERRHFGNA
ncbi:MAG: hypothetical protein Q8L87_15365 [Anaerolineales bacterium]|nr:hypothetical protein [Anaerolineales bacterium]